MKNTKIKVADLLKETSKEDDMQFEEVMIELEWLKEPWIKGDIHLTSFNQDTIETKFTNITCDRDQVCEKCNKEFVKSVWCDYYETTFTNNPEAFEDEAEDELFEIDKNLNIDLGESLRQAIEIQQPITTLCYDCINNELEDDDEDQEYFESSGNIEFS